MAAGPGIERAVMDACWPTANKSELAVILRASVGPLGGRTVAWKRFMVTPRVFCFGASASGAGVTLAFRD